MSKKELRQKLREAAAALLLAAAAIEGRNKELSRHLMQQAAHALVDGKAKGVT